MKIFVAGGSGLVGSDLILFLSKNNNVVTSYRNKKKIIKNKSVIWKKINFNKRITLNIKPDIIINCVGTHKFSIKKKNLDYIKSNIIAVKNIVDFAKKKKIKKIINLSTVSIYSSINNKYINENSPINVNDTLSLTKYLGEKIIEKSGINFVNLRLPGVLTYNMRIRRTLISKLIHDIKLSKKIKLFNPEQKFNALIDSFEIFNVIKKIIREDITGTYNFTSYSGVKFIKIILFIKKFFNSNSKIVFYKKRKKLLYFSTKKIQKDLNYKLPKILFILEKYLKKYYSIY
jgi:nucleoside-diphosphate-sugar epimerase